MTMLPAELIEYCNSVIYSTFFTANYFMWREVGGYFGVQGDTVPLLHLWSLAVEEQFYIFWPIFLFIIYKLIKQKYICIIIAISAIVGLWISEWGVNNYIAASYYLMPTRAFELLIGAWISLIPRVQWGNRVSDVIAMLGVFLIMFPAITYTKDSIFPGYNAVAPCLGTALIIIFANHQFTWVGRFLGIYPIVFLGRISYPAYLWHWPIIVFIRIHLIDIDKLVASEILIITLLLSTLTYWYIEKPSKKAHSFKLFKVAGVGFSLPALVFILFAVATKENKGWPQRFDESLSIKSEAILSYSNKIRGRCNEGNVASPLPPDQCILGINKPGVDILLIGDSHANHFTGMIDVLAKDAGLRGYDVTQSQTIYLPETRRFYVQDGKEIEHSNFYIRNKVIQQKIKQDQYKFVVLGGSFAESLSKLEYSLDGDEKNNGKAVFKSQFEKAIIEIIQSNAKPYIIKGAPTYSSQIQSCTLNNQRFNRKDKCYMSIADFEKELYEWNQYLNYLVIKYPIITVIDPSLVMCDKLNCFSELNGIPLYRDGSHLNYIGSRLVGEIYLRQFINPFKPYLNQLNQ